MIYILYGPEGISLSISMQGHLFQVRIGQPDAVD
jgi:hypothetical protein